MKMLMSSRSLESIQNKLFHKQGGGGEGRFAEVGVFPCELELFVTNFLEILDFEAVEAGAEGGIGLNPRGAVNTIVVENQLAVEPHLRAVVGGAHDVVAPCFLYLQEGFVLEAEIFGFLRAVELEVGQNAAPYDGEIVKLVDTPNLALVIGVAHAVPTG